MLKDYSKIKGNISLFTLFEFIHLLTTWTKQAIITDNPDVSPSALCLRKPSLFSALANKLPSFDYESWNPMEEAKERDLHSCFVLRLRTASLIQAAR